MEFNFSINSLFSDLISVITGESSIAVGYAKPGKPTINELETTINTIGVKSAQAQNLPAPITTWRKLRINKHRIYLLKNPAANNGRGHVIGFIKVGQKQLFVLDREGTHNEMHPVCVLDFYIHESQQRRGNGLKLFNFMLQAEDIEPAHLAIDRPSSKFISFLRKHFKLWATIPQVNNFVVFDGFFKNRKDKRRLPKQSSQHQYEDSIQPLPRAYTEDIIIRKRKNYPYNNSLNGVRPLSGSGLNVSDQLRFSRFHNSDQKPQTDHFSKFTSDENSYAMALPDNRRYLRSRQEEKIVTNPYRRMTNSLSKSRQAVREKEDEDPKPLQELQPLTNGSAPTNDDSFMSNSKSFTSEAMERGRKRMFDKPKHDFEPNSPHGSDGNSCNEGFVDTPPQSTNNSSEYKSNERFFEAEIGYNSIRNPRYNKPSDMILELKNKDQEAKNRNSTSKQRYNSAFLGTSWNIFGVPPPSRQRWGHK